MTFNKLRMFNRDRDKDIELQNLSEKISIKPSNNKIYEYKKDKNIKNTNNFVRNLYRRDNKISTNKIKPTDKVISNKNIELFKDKSDSGDELNSNITKNTFVINLFSFSFNCFSSF
uniref:Uncharacterized protein n=1 Tax=viral metagenome TaxID=1070528 RepID=A0A6C0BEH9_9ZZZZ